MMNLTKLFEAQKILRNRIDYSNPDRFEKLILALLVEIGECANEWRGFKFWSKDQDPRIKVPVIGWGEPFKNPLLEEHVDGLHFVLEIGLELGFTDIEIWSVKEKNITNQLIECYGWAHNLYFQSRVSGGVDKIVYENLVNYFLSLGEMLGFTWEEIEQAYYAKNQINHQRQSEGY